MRILILSFFVLNAAFVSGQALIQEANGFMLNYRYLHQSAYLENDVVMVAGGWMDGSTTTSVEIFNPGTGEWEEGTPMNAPRTTFAMAALNNGYVIAAGGWDGGGTNYTATEIYDHDLEQWMEGPALSEGRADLVTVALGDGRILFCGGFNGMSNLGATDIYDPVSNTMTTGADMLFPRSFHAATLLDDGRVLVAGGFNPDFGFQMEEAEIYDPFLDTWTQVASLPMAIDHATLFNPGSSATGVDAILVGGRVFTGDYEGTTTGYVYDAAADTWTSFTLPAAISYAKAAVSVGEGAEPGATLFGGVNDTGNNVSTTYSGTMYVGGETNVEAALVNPAGEDRWNPSVCPMVSAGASEDRFMVTGGDSGQIGTYEIWGLGYVGVDEEEKKAWSCFPNPAIDRVTLMGEQFDQWSIYNTNGAIVATGKASIIEVGLLARGNYILEVQQGERKQSMQIQLK